MAESAFVLVGAGAGPDISTGVLTEALLAWDGAGAPGTSGSAEPRPFFRWLLDSASSAYPHAQEAGSFGFRLGIVAPNFEELIHLTERLSYLLQERYYDSLYRRPPPYEVDFYQLSDIGRMLAKTKAASLLDVVVWASNHILDVVAARAATSPAVESREIIRQLRARYVVKLFSLNYDTRVVDLQDNWWTGFSPFSDDERPSWFKHGDPREIFRLEPEIPVGREAFIQLHGSTHFTWIEDYIAPRYKIARSPRPIAFHKTPRREGFALWNDRSALPVLPMITGFRKGEKTLVEPYLSYLHYMRSESYRTPRWVIIGYGGGDPHVNAILRSAADHWGDNLRAFVFNYMTDDQRTDSEQCAQGVRDRVGFLGRSGRMALSSSDPSATILASKSITLTTDGRCISHIPVLCDFLQSQA